MKINSYKFIQLSLVIVYVWFGLLKVIGASPVVDLVRDSFPMFPQPAFLIFLGLYEILAGVLLVSSKTLKIGLILIWLQLGGIFFGTIVNPFIYFQEGNPFLLNVNGEFVIKNLILLAASYYLWEKNK